MSASGRALATLSAASLDDVRAAAGRATAKAAGAVADDTAVTRMLAGAAEREFSIVHMTSRELPAMAE
ncbi:DUF808 family protein [Chromohalobacter israelensis]|uniref:DUF808 family protein n=1 Tax=Chromohalobacter israelensis TaxID=141390 RepID=UPI0023EA7068|nr:DUF808 family protein [Chromohalobacter salexigens]